MKRSRAGHHGHGGSGGGGGGGGAQAGRAGAGTSSFQAKFGQRILKTSGDGSYVRLHAPASREGPLATKTSREALKQQQRERQTSGQRPEQMRKDFGKATFANMPASSSTHRSPASSSTLVNSPRESSDPYKTSLPAVRASMPITQISSEASAAYEVTSRVQIRSLPEKYFSQVADPPAANKAAGFQWSAQTTMQQKDHSRPSLADLRHAVQGATPNPPSSSVNRQPSQWSPSRQPIKESPLNAAAKPGGYMHGYAHMHAQPSREWQDQSQKQHFDTYSELPQQRQGYRYQYQHPSVDASAAASAQGDEMRRPRPRKHDPDVFAAEDDGKQEELPPKDVVNERLVKSEKDRLFYSRKHRTVSYKPCTTKEYLKNKPEKYYELGKLQADLNTEEVAKKREKLERMKSYGAKLRALNKQPPSPISTAAAATLSGGSSQMYGQPLTGTRDGSQAFNGSNQEEDALANQGRRVYQGQHPAVREQALREKRKAQSARQRALEFAKSVPKPRVRVTKTPTAESCKTSGFASPARDRVSGQEITELERLELEHDRAREEIEAIRRDFGNSQS